MSRDETDTGAYCSACGSKWPAPHLRWCHFGEADQRTKPDLPSPVVPVEGEIERMVRDFEYAIRLTGSSRREDINDQYDEELDTARSSLLDFVKAQQKELDDYKRLARLWENETDIRDKQIRRLRSNDAR